MTRILFLIILSNFCFSCYSQQCSSYVADSTRQPIIRTLLDNKFSAEFPFLYNSLTEASQMVEVFFASLEYSGNEKVSFSTNFIKYLKIDQNTYNYWIYNKSSSGYELVGNYNKVDDSTQIFWEPGNPSVYLNNIMRKFSDLKEVAILRLNGIPGYCVLYKAEIWVNNENEWTDLNTFLKSEYKLPELRSIVLIRK